MRHSAVAGATLLLLLWQGPSYAGSIILAWDMSLDWQAGTRYTLRIVTVRGGSPTATERVIDPFPHERCRQYPDPLYAPETLCGMVCLDAGDYTLSLFATRGSERSGESNVLDVDLTSTTPCQPTTVVQAPPAKPAKTAEKVVGAAAVVGAATVLSGGASPPSLPGMVNLGCVSWKVLGPCLCNPYTPCVTVEYSEPAYIVEVVKKPGDTLIPMLGDVLQAALSAVGIPALGGGGAGNASGSGHTNLFYSETHIYTFPDLLGGPCTGCAPSTAPLAVHYASEIDSATWRTAVAVPSPLELLQQVGPWGRLYPRGGKVIHSSEPVASALTAVRAMDIAHQPIGTPPNVDAHIVLKPTEERASCMQMAYPRQLPCFPPGTPNVLWEAGTLSMTGKYAWIMWQQRRCCVNPAQTTCGITVPGVGGYGQNWCLLPPLP